MSRNTSSYEQLEDTPALQLPLNTDQAITKVGGASCYQLAAGVVLAILFSLVTRIT